MKSINKSIHKETILEKRTLFRGNNLDALRTLDNNFVDSVVTDPPYGLSLLGNKWDYDVPSVEFWKEVYRVLKPGGHVLSFGGTRTYHRMVVAIEDAGFEIRDQIQWIYATGFPKSHDIGKAVDKIQGNERVVIKNKGTKVSGGGQLKGKNTRKESFVTQGFSEFEGWGTSLKPANEPICLARKPLSEKTIAENAILWGTGGLNIQGSKIYGEEKKLIPLFSDEPKDDTTSMDLDSIIQHNEHEITEGRFPTNVIFDQGASLVLNEAAKFFYIPKVSKKERNTGVETGNNHPTVKPVDLMRYLVKMVTPKNGVVLDPFMGSGSTGIASFLENFQFIGMELDHSYFEIAKQRVSNFKDYFENTPKEYRLNPEVNQGKTTYDFWINRKVA